MAITNTPVEGKIVVLKGSSTEVFEWPREGGVITRVSGQRVYYKDAAGNEKYTHAVCAVCDTPAEVARFLAFTERNLKRLAAFVDLCRAEEHALWEPGQDKLVEAAQLALSKAAIYGEVAGAKARAGTPAQVKPAATPPKTKGKAAAKPSEATMKAMDALKDAIDSVVEPEAPTVRRVRRVRAA